MLASVLGLTLARLPPDPEVEPISSAAASLTSEVESVVEMLVAVSSPSGDVGGAERALVVCSSQLPRSASVERVPCSSAGHARDMIARISGRGSARILLLGHLDTVFAHEQHVALRRAGDRWVGSGAIDMKGGVAISLAILRWLALRPELYSEAALLLVMDEEVRLRPLSHIARFESFDACLCFEAGERGESGEERVIVRRKAAGTLRVTARGRAAHAGSNPDAGANALLALADAAGAAASLHDPRGADGLSVVPSKIVCGGADNVVPASGELVIDVRAASATAFERVIDAIPSSSRGAQLSVELMRSWPGMDSAAASGALLSSASEVLARPIVGAARGGASDASHFAASIPLTLDGLGPCGGGAHTPDEFLDASSLQARIEVPMAICRALAGGAGSPQA